MTPGKNSKDCEALRLALFASSNGVITGEDSQRIIGLLANCWDHLKGSDAESTFSDKVSRAEELVWTPPLLNFQLERHGGAVMGSTRASVHYWSIDVEKETADIVRVSHRQIRRAANRVSLSPFIERVREAVISHSSDDFLEWKSADVAEVKIGKIVGGGNQQTVTSRRRRFRKELSEALAPAGWQVRLHGSRTLIQGIGQNRSPGTIDNGAG